MPGQYTTKHDILKAIQLARWSITNYPEDALMRLTPSLGSEYRYWNNYRLRRDEYLAILHRYERALEARNNGAGVQECIDYVESRITWEQLTAAECVCTGLEAAGCVRCETELVF